MQGGFGVVPTKDDGYYGQGFHFYSFVFFFFFFFFSSLAVTDMQELHVIIILGIYFTNDISYARSYGKYVFLCAVIPGNVYPITENPKDKDSFSGKAAMPGFQAHVTFGKVLKKKETSFWKVLKNKLIF